MESVEAQSNTAVGAAVNEARLRGLREAGVRAAALVFVDNAGVARMKCVPAHALAAAARTGVGLSVVFGGARADDLFATVPGIQSPTGDLRLVADLDAAKTLPCSPGWAWIPTDQRDQEGHPWPGCQRQFLRRMVESAAAVGLEIVAGFELEWTLGKDGADGFIPIHQGPGYGAATFPPIADYLLALVDGLQAAEVNAAQLHPEYAVGQLEISLAPRDPIGACDEAVFTRHLARTLSEQRGLRASFSPVAFPNTVANGAHAHFSVWQGGENQFSGGQSEAGLRSVGESFLAGVLAHMSGLTALAAPSPVSYLRLLPSHWAGAYTCWGHENREAALRLESALGPAASQSANVEWKSVDMAANPYLVFGGVIAAGLDGVQRELRLPPSISVDPTVLTASERRQGAIERLPETLAAAADAFAGSRVLHDAMGDLLHDSITCVRREEASASAEVDTDRLIELHRWRY